MTQIKDLAAQILTGAKSGFSAQQQHDAASKEMTMTERPRRYQSPAFKAKVAATKGEKTLGST